MKERIVCLFLALALVISIFGVRETVLKLVNASNVTLSEEEVKEEKEMFAFNANELNHSQNIQIQGNILSDDFEAETISSTEETQIQVVNEYYDNYFGEEISFDYEFVSNDDVMPYLLYTPSTVDETKKTPLIVWLHGSGEVGKSSDIFLKRGLPNVMNNWILNGFNAYVICPQLTGNWNTGRWNSETTKTNLQNLLDKFIANHNIDSEYVIVVGHSLGGQGALYMAHELSEYFTKCVVLSGYSSGIDIGEITIPTIGYVGTTRAGEDGSSVNYMQYSVAEVFGKENVFSIETSHGELPNVVFNFDTDSNGNSDVVEWMLKK